jgi:hypothetical protein
VVVLRRPQFRELASLILLRNFSAKRGLLNFPNNFASNPAGGPVHHPVPEILSAEFEREPFEEDRAQITGQRRRRLSDFGHLAIAERYWCHGISRSGAGLQAA